MTLGGRCREVIAKDCAMRSVVCRSQQGVENRIRRRLSDRLVRDFSLGRAVDGVRLMEEPRAGGSHSPTRAAALPAIGQRTAAADPDRGIVTASHLPKIGATPKPEHPRVVMSPQCL